MKLWAIAFWVGILLALAWCAASVVMLVVSQSYHPMSARGDLLFTLRLMAFPLALITAIAMLFVWSSKRPLPARTYQIGLVAAAFASVLPILPRIDSGYEQSYFIADQRHDIPWQLDPSGGSETPGGAYFRLRVPTDVFAADASPAYRALSRTITLGKAVDFNLGRGGVAPETPCTSTEHRFECEWQSGDFVYAISGDIELMPDDLAAFRAQTVSFIDGFVAPAP